MTKRTKLDFDKDVKTWRWRISKLDESQGGFAAKVGIGKTSLSFYLNGDRLPTLLAFQKIENYLRQRGV